MIHLKALIIGLALASPPVAAWVLHDKASTPPPIAVVEISNRSSAMADPPVTRIPVEIVSNGSEPKWAYIETPVQSIPEPGVLPLTALALTLLLRRKRQNS